MPTSESPTVITRLDRALALEAVRVTEAAAIAAAKWAGRGDEKAADQAAVDAMRTALNLLNIDGRIVIGEGERDEAPMLFIGEKVGSGKGPKVDIALDPLEGTTLTAKNMANACAVMAFSPEGGMLNAPDTYMDKIAIGPGYAEGLVDLDAPPQENAFALAKAKGVDIGDLTVCVMDRPRHEKLIAALREAGCKIALITDGDVAGVIHTTDPDADIDMYIGQGGAPEGVLACAALKAVGGQFQGRLVFRNDDERGRAERCGISQLDKKYSLHEIVRHEAIFVATGVTQGVMLDAVHYDRGLVKCHSLVMSSSSGTVRDVHMRRPYPARS